MITRVHHTRSYPRTLHRFRVSGLENWRLRCIRVNGPSAAHASAGDVAILQPLALGSIPSGTHKFYISNAFQFGLGLITLKLFCSGRSFICCHSLRHSWRGSLRRRTLKMRRVATVTGSNLSVCSYSKYFLSLVPRAITPTTFPLYYIIFPIRMSVCLFLQLL